VIVERSMDPRWLSNAYVVGSEPGGTALFVDSGAPLEPLFAAVEREGLRPTHLLITHGHGDHVAGNDEILERYDVEVATGDVTSGELRVRALPTPGHHDDMVAFLVNDTVVFTGDTLFRGSVGGGNFEEIRSSVMDVLMALPPETRVLPGHTDETTIGREWEENPFVRIWRGVDPEGTGRCLVDAREARLVLLADDYDRERGGTKAWVRYADGRDAIVGGSRVEPLP
jgi:hydroxyacylglutathione hydrolase